MHAISTTSTWTVCRHFSSTVPVAKLLSRLENSLIICRGQFNSASKQRSGQNAQQREEETFEEKVQKTFVELLSKDQIDAN